MIFNQQVEFFQSGGDPQWLEGLEFAPAKIRKLAQINALLAHQPWRVSPWHILQLTRGDDSWSLPEVVQALAILAIFHSLAAFCWGMGVNPEVDRRADIGYKMASNAVLSLSSDEPDAVVPPFNAELILRMKQFTERSDTDSISSSASSSNIEVVHKLFEESEIPWTPKSPHKSSTDRKRNINDFSHFQSGVQLEHEDFDVKSTEYKVCIV